MRLLLPFFIALLLTPTAAFAHGPHHRAHGMKAIYSPPSNPNKTAAMAPNIDISTYRRCYASSEKVTINLQAFNVPVVHFTAYRFNLSSYVTNSAIMDDFEVAEEKIDLDRLSPAASWNTQTGKSYIDQWTNLGSNVPRLAPGVYLIVGSAKGIEKRTWLAITDSSLLVKRSDRELMIWSTDIVNGTPQPGVSLAIMGRSGIIAICKTGVDGIARIPFRSRDTVWIEGTSTQGPVFALSGAVDQMDPFTVYAVTDRPVYRPGTLVQFKATIRRNIASPGSPGRIEHEVYANSKAEVEFRDSTDALIETREVSTNGFGSLSGSFQLAPECGQGSWHINVILGGYTSFTNFTVESYRKPEMTVSLAFDKAHYLCGSKAHAILSAQYYYGRPVADATVKYSVIYNGSAGSYDAKGTTDGQGQFVIDVPTTRMPTDQDLAINATVTDFSRRTYSANADTLIAAGMFRLSLSSDQPVYKTGSRITMIVNASDYDNQPVAAKTEVTMIETKEDNQHREYLEKTTKVVVTGRDGEGKAVFSCPRPGNLDFIATAYDGQNDAITAETSVTVQDQLPPQQYQQPPSLALTANQQSYMPGETAVIAIDTTLVGIKHIPATKDSPEQPAHPDAWALITEEGEQLGIAKVVHLTKTHSDIKLPLTDLDFPSIEVHVEIIQDHTVTDQSIVLAVNRKEQELSVSVIPDKQSYSPGDASHYKVTTLDWQGKPVSAEVSIGVVDASIYDIQPDNSEDIEQTFYSGQTVRINTDFSFGAQYSGGGYQTVAPTLPAGAPATAGIRVRNNFADTAYWAPAVTTGTDGTATISFTVPDNLTTWRATAHAISMNTAIGSTTNDVISVMPLLVKLELPRFVVSGDKSIFSAIVQNGTTEDRVVHITANATGATLAEPAQQIIDLPPGAQKRLDWAASVTGPDKVVFEVTADGGAGGQDAAESTLPVVQAGLQMVTADSTELTDQNTVESIDLSKLVSGSKLTLNLSTSLACSLADAVDDLMQRPDGDAECAASALSADVSAAEALRATGASPRRDVQQDVSLALQKLYLYQHPDGGWNWWEFDQSDGSITSSVLDALLSAKAAGYSVDDQRILRGITALRTLLKSEEDQTNQVSWLYTLVRSGATDSDRSEIEELYKNRADIDDYGKASLASALLSDGSSADTASAQTVIAELSADGITEGRGVSWPAKPGACPWDEDDIAVTAHALQVLLLGKPDSPLIPGVVRWLMANRDGNSWDNSEADALAVSAIASSLTKTADARSNFTGTVALDGETIGTIRSGTPNSLSIILTPAELAGHKVLTVSKSGIGRLYVDETKAFLIPSEQTLPQSAGISIAKHFLISIDDPSQSESLISGSSMQVQLDINADTDYRYIRVEDAIPAGCEVADEDNTTTGYPIDSSDGTILFTDEDIRDDRVVFSFDSLPKGHTEISYQLDTEQPGTYTILPAIASLNYFPEVRGNSGMAHVVIVDQP